MYLQKPKYFIIWNEGAVHNKENIAGPFNIMVEPYMSLFASAKAAGATISLNKAIVATTIG